MEYKIMLLPYKESNLKEKLLTYCWTFPRFDFNSLQTNVKTKKLLQRSKQILSLMKQKQTKFEGAE